MWSEIRRACGLPKACPVLDLCLGAAVRLSVQHPGSWPHILPPLGRDVWLEQVQKLCARAASDPVQTLLGSQKLLLGVPRGEAASTEICQLAQLTLGLDPPASSSGVVPDLWVKSHRAFLFPLEEVGAPNTGLQGSPGAMAPCHHSHTLGRVSGRCVARPCHNTFACLRVI